MTNQEPLVPLEPEFVDSLRVSRPDGSEFTIDVAYFDDPAWHAVGWVAVLVEDDRDDTPPTITADETSASAEDAVRVLLRQAKADGRL